MHFVCWLWTMGAIFPHTWGNQLGRCWDRWMMEWWKQTSSGHSTSVWRNDTVASPFVGRQGPPVEIACEASAVPTLVKLKIVDGKGNTSPTENSLHLTWKEEKNQNSLIQPIISAATSQTSSRRGEGRKQIQLWCADCFLMQNNSDELSPECTEHP